MSTYKLHYSGVIVLQRLASGEERQVPLDPSNGDYQTYLAWRAAGNTPDPADPPPPVDPQYVADQETLRTFPTRTQVQQALTAIDADLVTLGGAITLAQAVPILRRTVQNLKSVVGAVNVLVHRG